MIKFFLQEIEKCLHVTVKKNEANLLGDFCLQIEKQFDLWMKEENERIVIKSIILPVFSIRDPETLFINLMKANFLGQGSGNGIISLHPEESCFIYSLILKRNPTYLHFKDGVEMFLNYLEFWRNRLKDIETKDNKRTK